MSSDQQTQEFSGATSMGPGAGSSPSTSASPTDEHPEMLVGAAFAGGFVAAMILKRLVG